jgi:tripartite-type tricarboxylate transporter receptor subunit TctC
VQATPDGGTLLLTTSSVTMVPTIYPKLAFDPLRDLTSISLVTEVPISLAVRAASPFRDLADLIARAKAEPGKYTFGSGGVGTGNHLAGELLKKLAGIDLLHVPFRGVAPALTALYAGDIDMLFASTVETVSHARDRRIRVLGVGSPQPIPELPDSPAIGDLVPGYVATNWYGLFGPRGLPAGVLTRLQTELPKAGADAALKEKAAALGMTMMLLPADALRAESKPRCRAGSRSFRISGSRLNNEAYNNIGRKPCRRKAFWSAIEQNMRDPRSWHLPRQPRSSCLPEPRTRNHRPGSRASWRRASRPS